MKRGKLSKQNVQSEEKGTRKWNVLDQDIGRSMLHVRQRGVLYFHMLSVLDSIKILAQLSSLLFIFYFWLSQFFVNIWVLFFINLKNSLKGVLQLFCLSFSTFSFNCGCCTGLNTIIKFPHALANLLQIFHLKN